MQKYKCSMMYDGTNYSGYQVQPNAISIQSEIERVLGNMHKGATVKIVGSGRTDAGVHAIYQVFHFSSPLEIGCDGWVKAMNAQLPKDIRIMCCERVHYDFHARYDVKEKTYLYKLYNSLQENPFKRNYSVFFPYTLDMPKMKEAAKILEGTHDYTSFCSARSEVEDKVRTITEINIEVVDDEIFIKFTGNGFLYNMVRILVGTLLDVGQARLELDEVARILAAKDRKLAPKTAPAHGLYLFDVKY